MDTQQAILLEAMEAFAELGVSSGGPAQRMVLERRDGEAQGAARIQTGGRGAAHGA